MNTNILCLVALLLCSCAPSTSIIEGNSAPQQDRRLETLYTEEPKYRYACLDERQLAGRTILAGKNICGVAVQGVAYDSQMANVAVRINYEAAVGQFLAPKWDARWIDIRGNFPMQSNGFASFQFPVFSPPTPDFFGNISRSLFESLLIAAPGVIGAALGVPIPNTTEAAIAKFVNETITNIAELARSNKLRFNNVQVCFNVTGLKFTSATACFAIKKP
jgi:hypothetical protein